MQERFGEVADPRSVPVAMVHGNPHLDNYAKTGRGAAMVDFDRSRFGPYSYDIIRFLVSLAVRAGGDRRLLHPVVLVNFKRGYAYGAHGLGHEGVSRLLSKEPKRWQQSTRAYVSAGGPWAARLRKHAIDRDDPRIEPLLSSYFESRSELELLERFRVKRAAEVAGSMGKKHLVVLLDPNDPDEDQRLIDIKETYAEPDTEWFHNPFPHQGMRMVVAGDLYAPGWEVDPGYATLDGQQYWGRQIPTQKLKLKTTLPEFEQVDVAFSVASQLGAAHRTSMVDVDNDQHIEHFESTFNEMVEVARHLRRELELSHALYVREVLQAYEEPALLAGVGG
jgi:uncharacterized protein (DUF2252 family)